MSILSLLRSIFDSLKNSFGSTESEEFPTTESQEVKKNMPNSIKKKQTGYFESEKFQRANAEYFKSISGALPGISVRYMTGIFRTALGKFFGSCGNCRIIRDYKEISVGMIAVDVYKLNSAWDTREVDLKQVILLETRMAYCAFYSDCGWNMDHFRNVLPVNVWWANNSLVFEIPYSMFTLQYPHMVPILAPEEYCKLRRALDKADKF